MMTDQILIMSEEKNKSDARFKKLFVKFKTYKNFYVRVNNI